MLLDQQQYNKSTLRQAHGHVLSQNQIMLLSAQWQRHKAINNFLNVAMQQYLTGTEPAIHEADVLRRLPFAVEPLRPVHFLLLDPQSRIHCLIICGIQLLTLMHDLNTYLSAGYLKH